MATAASDSNVEQDNGNKGEGRNSNLPDTNKSNGSETQDNRAEDPARKSQSSQSRKQTERTVTITETRSESIQGLDDLSSCINSVDDHVQAGLQELRSCVTNLRKERTNMSEKLQTLTEEVYQVSVERDHYQLAIEELQQEVSSLREQLCSQKQDKEELHRRMQEMQQRNDNHLVNIAGQQRSKRLAHNVIVRWRRKALDKNLGCREHLCLLEEENNQLRAELLLCQEAAKQAFLRSATALNSEAITMFQDAATRRLGFEETSSHGSQTSRNSSPPDSPGRHPHTSREKSGDAGVRSTAENKENSGGDREGRTAGTHGCTTHTGGRERLGNEGDYGSSDDRSYIATCGSDDPNHLNSHRGNRLSADVHQRTFGNYGEREVNDGYGHESDLQQPLILRSSEPYRYNPSSEDVGAVGGRVPSMNKPTNLSSFEPNALQRETRAYLQQLQEERRRRPDRTHTSGFESQRKTLKTAPSHPNSKHKMCSCRSRGDTAVAMQMPYKCPYCTPVQNSSFGHAKDAHKKSSNATRNTILSSTNNTDKKKVLYKPSASTIVIEKHITR